MRGELTPSLDAMASGVILIRGFNKQSWFFNLIWASIEEVASLETVTTHAVASAVL